MNFVTDHLSLLTGAGIDCLASANALFGLLFLLLWAISAMAGVAKKKQQQRKPTIIPHEDPPPPRQRRMPQPMRRGPVARPVPVFKRPSPISGSPRPAPTSAPASEQQPSWPPRAPKASWRVPPPIVFHTPRPTPPTILSAPAPSAPIPTAQAVAPVAPLTPARPKAVPAAAIHRWLTPQTLRSQYILTEIFQPPLALRENRLFD